MTVSVREYYNHKKMQMIDYDVEVSCAVQSCIHQHQGTQCSPEKHSLRHNSTNIRLKSRPLAGRIRKLMLFALYSDSAVLHNGDGNKIYWAELFFPRPQMTGPQQAPFTLYL
ncbi:uncharacterized protein TNCV_1630171 [Trichonephila clavipes]|uniref:Uncharacterized protein n=1 Tax=Trichonephila clavipes TaxID=2585209 RepID=A0A8X6VWH2_TRICX|nr:uncharacterized protein TNCV_1630171 [Trichonephila clavipes]